MRGVLRRFIDIWKLDFLAVFIAGEKDNNKTTILFWIFSTLLLTVFAALVFFFILFSTSDELVEFMDKYVPNDAQIDIVDGKMMVQNIEQPFLREIKTNIKNNQGVQGTFFFVIDMQGDTYDDATFDKYDGGVAIYEDHMKVKDALRSQEISFKDIDEFSLSKNEIVDAISNSKTFAVLIGQIALMMSVFVFFWLMVGRLVFAFWWALMLWVFMKVAEMEESYLTAYKAVLNFYFIPTIVSIILLFFGLQVPLLVTMIFTALFVANIIWIKRQPEKPISIEAIKDITTKTVSNDEIAEETPTKTLDNSDKSK